MKRLVISALAALLTMAGHAQETAYRIDGRVTDGVKKAYIRLSDSRQPADSVDVKDGRFTLSGKMPLNSIMVITAGKGDLTLFNDGTPVDVDFRTMDVKASPLNVRLAGTQSQLNRHNPLLESLYASYDSLSRSNTEDGQARVKDVVSKIEAVEDTMVNEMKGFVATNRDNLIPAVYLQQIYFAYDYDELSKMLDPAAPYYNHPAVARAKAQLASLEKRKPGKMFMDMTLNDMAGKPRKLSEWCGKGNYVLIDFWASWCGPCRREMPNVVANYAKYHAKGFEIVGVSFDKSGDSWRAAVKKLGMTWPQISDLKYWKAEAVSLYGITSIPSNILLDKDGRIIAVNLMGDDLGNKLKEVYGF